MDRAATEGLMPLALRPLPLGSVRAQGWLQDQLRIQADGLGGHLDEFWPDIKDSGWFGGAAEGWERAPYWLDGIVPLAYTLDDPALKQKVERYIGCILDRQAEDGWLGPPPPPKQVYDIWPLLLVLKVLTQYADATDDARAMAGIEKGLACIDDFIRKQPLNSWAMFRWFEGLIAAYWLYDRQPRGWLLELGSKLRAQGFDYASFYAHSPPTEPSPRGKWGFMRHVVNTAMAIKGNGLWWRQSRRQEDRRAVYNMIATLGRYHGQAAGVFSGDECISGKSPVQGTELCAVVEYMYSLEQLLTVWADPALADRLEKIAFNALPATFTPDMWGHQYDQQANQVECSIKQRRWANNGPESNIFGLEPNFGCCTANLSQGWPKFAANLWMSTPDDGLACVAHAPSVACTSLHGVPVEARLDTGYPFRDTLQFSVRVDREVTFPLLLRIPGWTGGATLAVSGESPVQVQPGTFHRVQRAWCGTTQIRLTLPMRPVLERRYNRAATIQRGPLVYSLKIGEQWKQVNEDKPFRKEAHGDWEVYPTSPWNYALAVDNSTLEQDVAFAEHPIGHQVFSPDHAPVSATVRAGRVPTWEMEEGSAGDVPGSPVRSSEPLETITLIPYGCTNLRVTEFPVLAASSTRRKTS